MTDPVNTYLTVLFVGIALTLVVGQILMRSGQPFLQDVFPKKETATSVARLLAVLFHLIVLGVIALVSTIDFTLDNPVQTIVARLGLVLLILGVAHGFTLVVLTRLRARRRTQMLLEEQTRAQQQYGQPGMDAAPSYPQTAQTYPLAEPDSGR